MKSTTPSTKTYRPPQIKLAAGRDGKSLNDRRRLLEQLDRFRADVDINGGLKGTEDFRDLAFQLLTSPQAAKAFDISRENDKLPRPLRSAFVGAGVFCSQGGWPRRARA